MMTFENGFDIYEIQFMQGEVLCVRARDLKTRDTYEFMQRENAYEFRGFNDRVIPGMLTQLATADVPGIVRDIFDAKERMRVVYLQLDCPLTELRPDLEKRVA